jgi:hypothetical protein
MQVQGVLEMESHEEKIQEGYIGQYYPSLVTHSCLELVE